MTKPTPDSAPVRRIDRILAFTAFGVIALSIVCFFVVLLGRPLGYLPESPSGLWLSVIAFPLIGLPIGFLLILTLLIMTFVRRSRANKV